MIDANILGMDLDEFNGPTIQRVYQYLRRHASNKNLDRFSYMMGSIEGTVKDFLTLAIRYVQLHMHYIVLQIHLKQLI